MRANFFYLHQEVSKKEKLFRPIANFPGYSVNSVGVVISFRPRNGVGPLLSFGRKLSYDVNSCGYVRYGLYREGKLYRGVIAHRLVAEAFIPNPNGLKFVNHINGIKTDNAVDNLEWCSTKHNILHSRRVLGKCVCENHGRSKISNSEAAEIFSSNESNEALAERFGLNKSSIERIKTRKNWTQVTETLQRGFRISA